MELVTLIQTPGWTSPAPPRPLLTFILLHTDSGVGEDTGVSLQVVVVGAVIILILEGAVLTTLLCGERGHSCEVTRTDLGAALGTHTHGAGHTGDTAPSAPSSASPVTFLQLLHHLDLELARAAVAFQVACPPGLAAHTVPDALTHSLEALAEVGGMVRDTPRREDGHSPERQSWRGSSSSQSQGRKRSLRTSSS